VDFRKGQNEKDTKEFLKFQSAEAWRGLKIEATTLFCFRLSSSLILLPPSIFLFFFFLLLLLLLLLLLFQYCLEAHWEGHNQQTRTTETERPRHGK